MSQIYVSVGQTVKIIDIIGLEGSTGYSTGSHCHYCCRVASTMTLLDMNAISSIPNVASGVYSDGAFGGSIPGSGAVIGGNLRGSGYGCNSPVIKKALDKCFVVKGLSAYSAMELKNVSL